MLGLKGQQGGARHDANALGHSHLDGAGARARDGDPAEACNDNVGRGGGPVLTSNVEEEALLRPNLGQALGARGWRHEGAYVLGNKLGGARRVGRVQLDLVGDEKGEEEGATLSSRG